MEYRLPKKFVGDIELRNNGCASHYVNELLSVDSELVNIRLYEKRLKSRVNEIDQRELEKHKQLLQKRLQDLVTYRASLAYEVCLHNSRDSEKVDLDKLIILVFVQQDAQLLDNLSCSLRGIGLAAVVEGSSVIQLDEISELIDQGKSLIKKGKYVPDKFV